MPTAAMERPPWADRLASLMDERGHRWVWLARQVGLRPQKLSDMVTGRRRMPPEVRRAIARTLQVPYGIIWEED